MKRRFLLAAFLGVLAPLLLSFPGRAIAGYYRYYYEGIVDVQISKDMCGYYMGCVSTENHDDQPGTIWYEQQSTKTVTCSVSGSLRFGASVKVDALARINSELGMGCNMSVTWTAGVRKGAEYVVGPWKGTELKAYLYKGKVSGKEVVRVEYYPEQGGDPPPNANGGLPGEIPPVLGSSSVWYEYNNFTASYPSANEFHIVRESWDLPH